MLTHADFFAGLGVFSLAARELLISTQLLCEWNDFCQTTLRKNFPGVLIHNDITNFNPFPYDGAFDIITLRVQQFAGTEADPGNCFTAEVPCPPFSRQGQRLAATDNRNRFDDFLRVIAGCRPRWVIIENVPGLLDAPIQPGGEAGSFFANLLWQLSQVGYVGEWLVLSAAQFGLPHHRQRLFIIAYPHSTQFAHQPTAWAEQVGSQTQAIRANSTWRGSKSRVVGGNVRLTDGVFVTCGVAKGNAITRRRREALGNTICRECAIAALKRVLYLNSLCSVGS